MSRRPDKLVAYEPARGGETSESGALTKGIDAWIAHELRRAEPGPEPSEPSGPLMIDIPLFLDL